MDWDAALPQEAEDEPWWTDFGYSADSPPEWVQDEYDTDQEEL